jgi:hypothetical protein
MAKISEMIPSSYLKQSDIDQDYIVTVKKIENKNIARDDEPAENKWLVHFREFDKPMVLNSTNIQLMAQACDSDDTNDWTGKEVIIFTDPNVSFGGKLVGGLRIRKHKTVVAASPKQRIPAMAPHPDDDYVPQ